MPCVDGEEAGRREGSLARRGHAAARPDGERYRGPRCFPRDADERGVQGTGGQGAGAPAQARSDEAAPARYGEGLWPETAPAQAALLEHAHRPGTKVIRQFLTIRQSEDHPEDRSACPEHQIAWE